MNSGRLSKEFIRKIKKSSKVYLIKNSDNKLKNLINYHYRRFFWNIFSYLNIKNTFYGNDDLKISSFFRRNNFYILEDGVINYNYSNQLEKTLFKKIFKRVLMLQFKNYKSFGIEKNIQKIYLTGLGPIPKEIEHKVEIINLKELWDKKTLEEQNEILEIFSFDLYIKEKINGRDMILFTQPLSEDKILTEEEKIEIYSKIIKKYPKDRLVIKTHPREKTDYKNIFKEYLVLDNPFPFEILNLLDVKFTKAITLFSTAALGLGKNVETDFYGTEIHPKIFDRIGSCDNIMKRNCFLKEEK